MFLILMNTLGGREILTRLKDEGIDTTVMLPSVYDAAIYGIDNVTVGSLKEARIRKCISQNNAIGVIDALSDSENDVSFNLSRICEELNLPLIKYISSEPNYIKYKSVLVFDGVNEVADIINSTDDKTLMFGAENQIKCVAEWVLDKRKLYTVVLKGGEMNVEFSVNSHIPLANIIPADSLEGIADISDVIARYGITRLVCYENLSVLNKINIAESTKSKIFIIKKERPKYGIVFDTIDKITAKVKNIAAQREKQKEENESGDGDLNKKESIVSEFGLKYSGDTSVSKVDDNGANNGMSDEERVLDAKDASSDNSVYEKLHIENINVDSHICDIHNAENDETETVDKAEVNYQNSDLNLIDEIADMEKNLGIELKGDCSVPKSKVINKDGTINMTEIVKYVRRELNIDDE